MTASHLPSSSTARATNRKRESGMRLVIGLSFLIMFVAFFTWTENPDELYNIDYATHTAAKLEFWGPHLGDDGKRDKLVRRNSKTTPSIFTDDDQTMRDRIKSAVVDDDDNLFETSQSIKATPIIAINTSEKKKEKKVPLARHRQSVNEWMDSGNSNNNRKPKYHKGSRRHQRQIVAEKFKAVPILSISTTDDNIPLAAGGSVVHAVDALLCRDAVLDYVVNATDLKDECDGLKKAYTQNCAPDDQERSEPQLDSSSSSPISRRQRKLQKTTTTKNYRVLYYQHQLSHWSQRLQSWWSKPKRYASEDKILEAWDQKIMEEGQALELELEILDHFNAMHRRMTDQVLENEAGEDQEKFSAVRHDGKEEAQEVKDATKTKDDSSKRPLANLALPVTTKHVSGKMLTETLMLQQDSKLIKTVVDQTNHTVTGAQTDAAVSSKAVSDAADMISNVLNDPTSIEARTCCTSILNVFHESCSVDEEEELSDRKLLVGVLVIALCGLVKSLVRHFQLRWLPEAAACIMVGVAAGYISTFYPHHDISFDGKMFLRIMVPPIVFEAALSIDKRSFTRHIIPILIYAILGTLIATGATAVVISKGSNLLNCEYIPYPEALAFGALISSIDPIAVLSVLSNMGMTDQDTIYVVIFGESLLNDGVAIVLFETIVHFLDDNMIVDSHAVTAAAIHFLVVFVGSLLIGIGFGLCCTLYYWIMFGCQTSLVEVLMFLCWALVPYYVCDGIEWSGIVALVAAGFIMDMYVVGTEKLTDIVNDELDSDFVTDPEKGKERRRRAKVRRPIFSKEGLMSNEAKTHISFVTEIIATMMETAIFAYLGLFLFSSRYHWNINYVFLAIFGCCLSRAIMIPSLSFTANWITKIQQSGARCRLNELSQQSHHPDAQSNRPNQAAGVIIDSKMQMVLWFAGLRGAMSFALVEHIPLYDAVSGEGTRLKSELKAMTSACIIFTVFFLGGGTFYMMEALGLALKSKSEGGLERETEMIGLLSSVETDDKRDNVDGKDWIPQDNENGGEIITRKPSTNSLRQPGKPVRRQRNAVIT